MSEVQQYYHSNVGHCTIWGDVVDQPDWVLVTDNSDYGEIRAVKRSELHKLEDTWEYQQAQKRADEIRMVYAKAKENMEELAEQIVDKALQSLASRIKFNVAFGKATGGEAYAIVISTELEKLIRESGKKLAEGKKKDPFDL